MTTARKSPKKAEVFRSMAELRQTFFPEAVAASEERADDPAYFGPRLAERAMEGFHKRLVARGVKCAASK